MTVQSFTQKLIEIDISLGADRVTNQPRQFGNGKDSVTLSGSRMSVRIQACGTPNGSNAQVDVFGLPPTLMNELSTLGMVFQLVPQNTMTIRAGDEVSGLATVFVGTILSAVADYSQAPNVPIHFEVQSGTINAVAPFKASSFPSPTDVGTIMSGLAKAAQLGFENSGVSITLPPTYLSGSALDQIEQVAAAANIRAELVPGASGALVLAIFPKGQGRSIQAGGKAPLISPTTGMIGYPSYTQQGILVKCIFNPQIGFAGIINVESSLPKATGTWIVLRLDHALDTLVKGGQWESSMWCYAAPAAGQVLPNPPPA